MGAFQYRHQHGVEHAERHQHDQDGIHEPGAGEVCLDGLLQARQQRLPVQQYQIFMVLQGSFGNGGNPVGLITVTANNNAVCLIAHVKHVTEGIDGHAQHLPVDVASTGFEYADHGCDGGGDRAIPSTAQQGQFITRADFQIACQDAADHDFIRHTPVQVTSLFDQPRDGRHLRFILRIDAADLGTDGARIG